MLPTGPPLLLFGPQFPRLSQSRLSELQTFIAGNSDLDFLVGEITELPSLWPALERACPDLGEIPGAEELKQLQGFLTSGALPNIKVLSNILLAPLTVITQVVEFLSRGRQGKDATVPTSFQTEYRSGNVQGFCVGFLAAAAVACSRTKTEFQQLTLVALRLAVCVGAIVDLDERTLLDPLDHSCCLSVRWTMDSEQALFERTLDRYQSVSCYVFSYIFSPFVLELKTSYWYANSRPLQMSGYKKGTIPRSLISIVFCPFPACPFPSRPYPQPINSLSSKSSPLSLIMVVRRPTSLALQTKTGSP